MRSFRIGLHPRAAVDIDTIARWWREHRPTAPGLFVDELDRAFAIIAARTCVLRRTKYVVIYNIDVEAGETAVARVRHGRRRPLAAPARR